MDSFSKTEDTVNLEDAEFKITSTSTADVYTIYNEKTQQYLLNKGANDFFTTTASNMKIAATTDSNPGTFRICQTGGTKYVVFYNAKMNFNANSTYSAGFAGSYELVLLEKQDQESAGDVIPGYKRVYQITSGKNYLISYIYQDNNKKDHVIILYPENGTSAQTKLVGEKTTRTTPTQYTLTITGIGEGTTTAVVDGMTYSISCEGNEKIRLAAGQSYDLGSSEVTVADSSVAAIETQTVKKDKMSDYNTAVKNSLTTFKEEVNASAQLQDIEFIATADGSAYTLYNPNTKYYLLNSNATTYFTTDKATQNITKVDGQDSFEIQSPTNKGYVYFYNENMGFDRVSSKDGYTDKGDFALEFLEKQSTVSDSDPIPGYKRVSRITSGRKYLITQFVTNGSVTNIILLYPQNGVANQTKLYRQVTEEEKTLKALKTGKTTATIDGKTYDIIVGSDLAKPEVTLTAPTEGQTLTKAAVSNLSNKVTVKTIWKSGNKVLADNAKMEAGKAYTAIITLTATGADTVEVTGITEKGKKKAAVKISSTMKGNGKTYKITSVAANALKGNKKMTSLTIGNNVVTIGKNAFANCTKLKKVTVNGSSLKTIGKNAFGGDKKLKTINMKKVKSLKTVAKGAFKAVNKKVTVKVPKAKKAAYKRLFKKGGIAASRIKC